MEQTTSRSDEPEQGQFWEVKAGASKDTQIEIIEVPDPETLTPAEAPFVVVQVVGSEDRHRLPLDDRWGSGIVRMEEAPSLNARQKMTSQAAHDRIVRLGVGTYGRDEPEEIVQKVLNDYATWGDGKPISEMIGPAEDHAERVLDGKQ